MASGDLMEADIVSTLDLGSDLQRRSGGPPGSGMPALLEGVRHPDRLHHIRSLAIRCSENTVRSIRLNFVDELCHHPILSCPDRSRLANVGWCCRSIVMPMLGPFSISAGCVLPCASGSWST